MTRKRIYAIAKELDVTSKELIDKLDEMGMAGMKAANTVGDDEYSLIVNLYREETTPLVEEKKVEKHQDKAKKGIPRPPIVSVLGHIDHGKTTLLDAIRKSRVVEKEAGGITQSIGAYQANLNGREITFIDTPGHKAFTGMRARGAQATDIAILVVAADDGIMAQTAEAIDHIQAAQIPMIVAINKIDKPNANVNKVLTDLAQRGLNPEDWGGETITVPISALNRDGIDELLEMILLVADLEDLHADPRGTLEASVIESHLSVGRGPVATAAIREGTLQKRDPIIVGSTYGRVKALINENGKRLDKAGPGQTVEILGLEDVPKVGTPIEVAKKIKNAKRKAEERASEQSTSRKSRAQMTVEELFQQATEKDKLSLVLKSSSTGALEAAKREFDTIEIKDIQLEYLHTGIGNISASDVLLASTATGNRLVLGFGVTPDPKAKKLAEQEGVIILTYDIIYDLVEQIERAMKRMVEPEYEEAIVGALEVRDLFSIPGGVVAGCLVTEGKAMRNGKINVFRGKQKIFTGGISSLRRFEDDVREVLTGRECGLRIDGFDDLEIGDRLEIFVLEEIEI